VVLVHGYGADGQDLISLGAQWQAVLPTVAFAAPNAPQRLPGSPGYQWFPIARIDPHEMRKGVEAAGPLLDAWLDAELAQLGLGPERLALVGFSQGTMLALHVGLRRARPAAIVGFSGMLAGPPPGTGGPPVLLTHGTDDDVIPASALFMSTTLLAAAGVPVQWHLAPGMGHGIDPDGMAMAGRFLADAFAGRLGRDGDIFCPVAGP
jgi:phospholipase/carboxylesterase